MTTEHSLAHATFAVERTYPASPARVFAAWSSAEAKGRWFIGPDEWKKSDHKLDFRVGGQESLSGGPPGGPVYYYRATFQDIVPDNRIVTTYDMLMDDRRISVSVATIELTPVDGGTRLVLTEQGVFLDGLDTVEQREQGTRELLDKLGRALAG